MSKLTKTGAECPCKCGEKFLWNNDMVWYETVNQEVCKEREIINEQTEDEDGIVVTMYQCPKCNAVLGFMCNDPKYGGPVFNHPEWEDIRESDWLDKYHVIDPQH